MDFDNFRKGVRKLAGPLHVTLAITALLAVGVSLPPIAWDIKTLGHQVPRVSGVLESNDIVFVSVAADARSGHAARYGLEFLAFPRGQCLWFVLEESPSTAWPPDGIVTVHGELVWTRSLGHHDPGIEESLRSDRKKWALVAADAAAADELARRLGVPQSRVHVASWTASSFWTKPRWRMSVIQLIRLLILIAAMSLSINAFVGHLHRRGVEKVFALLLAYPLTLVALIGSVFLLGFVTTSPHLPALVTLALCGAIASIFVPPGESPSFSRPRLSALALIALALGLAVFRLDFDGDIFTHWLPMARAHYLNGHHDFEFLLSRYGTSHEVAYPPGFPILISTLMWTSGMDRVASFAFGDATHVAVFLYRFIIAVLLAVTLFAAARARRGSTSRPLANPWVALGLCGFVPLFAGAPTAAEVLFVPIACWAVLCFASADRHESPLPVRLGIFLAGTAFFVKNDAIVVVPFLLLTWYLAHRLRHAARPNLIAVDLFAAAAGLTPFFVWKAQQLSYGVTQIFQQSLQSSASPAPRLHLCAELLTYAAKALLGSGGLIVLAILLPWAALRSRDLGWDWLVPLGIWSYVIGMALSYVFSTTADPLVHMSTSYLRILSTSIATAILWAHHVLERALDRDRAGAD